MWGVVVTFILACDVFFFVSEATFVKRHESIFFFVIFVLNDMALRHYDLYNICYENCFEKYELQGFVKVNCPRAMVPGYTMILLCFCYLYTEIFKNAL